MPPEVPGLAWREAARQARRRHILRRSARWAASLVRGPVVVTSVGRATGRASALAAELASTQSMMIASRKALDQYQRCCVCARGLTTEASREKATLGLRGQVRKPLYDFVPGNEKLFSSTRGEVAL